MRHVLLLVVLLCTACNQVTQTTVVIDADAIVTAANPQVRVEIFRADEVSGALEILERDQIVPSNMEYPIRIAIVPRGGDVGRRYEVRVRAQGLAGQVWETRAISGFVSGQHRELPMRLEDACRNVMCNTGSTCRGGLCASLEVDLSMPVAMTDARLQVDAGISGDAPISLNDAPRSDVPEGCEPGIFGTSLFGTSCFQ